MLRTDDAGRWTMDAGPSTPYYKLTGELKKLSRGFLVIGMMLKGQERQHGNLLKNMWIPTSRGQRNSLKRPTGEHCTKLSVIFTAQIRYVPEFWNATLSCTPFCFTNVLHPLDEFYEIQTKFPVKY